MVLMYTSDLPSGATLKPSKPRSHSATTLSFLVSTFMEMIWLPRQNISVLSSYHTGLNSLAAVLVRRTSALWPSVASI